eukprot:765293-Hanusia_phi.AAC.4
MASCSERSSKRIRILCWTKYDSTSAPILVLTCNGGRRLRLMIRGLGEDTAVGLQALSALLSHLSPYISSSLASPSLSQSLARRIVIRRSISR